MLRESCLFFPVFISTYSQWKGLGFQQGDLDCSGLGDSMELAVAVWNICHTENLHKRIVFGPPDGFFNGDMPFSRFVRWGEVKQSALHHRASAGRSKIRAGPLHLRSQRLPSRCRPWGLLSCSENSEINRNLLALRIWTGRLALCWVTKTLTHLSSRLSMWVLYQFLTSNRDCKQ